MSKRSKRIQVSLNPHMAEVIIRISELTKQSRSSVISGLLDTCYGPLVRMVALLEAAEEAPEAVRRGLLDTFEGLERELLSGDLEEIQGELYPPSSNRGVTNCKSLNNNGNINSVSEAKK